MKKLTDKKAIFFDLDHTLWDFEKNSALAFEQILTHNKVKVDTDEFISRHVPINAGYWKLYRDGLVTQQELRYGRLKDVFNAMQYEVDDTLIHTPVSYTHLTLPTKA